MSDIRKLMCEVIGFALLPDQITELRKEFEKLDVEQNGEISLDNLKKVLMESAGSGSYHFTEDEVEDIFNYMRLCSSILLISSSPQTMNKLDRKLIDPIM